MRGIERLVKRYERAPLGAQHENFAPICPLGASPRSQQVRGTCNALVAQGCKATGRGDCVSFLPPYVSCG